MAAEGGAERGLLLNAEFNDGDTVNAMFERLNVCYENTMYEKMKRKDEDDPSVDWGCGLNAMIASDCAMGRALGLFTYLSVKTCLNTVKLCDSVEDAKRCVDNGMLPDIVIFAGLPKKIEIYQIMHMVGGHAMFVIFDFLDDIVKMECRQYGIRYAFSSNKSIKDGVLYLQEAFEDNKKYSLH